MAFPAIRRLPLHMLGIGIVRIVALHAIVHRHGLPRFPLPRQPHVPVCPLRRKPGFQFPVRTVVIGSGHPIMTAAANLGNWTVRLAILRGSYQMTHRARVHRSRRPRKRGGHHQKGEEGEDSPHTNFIGRIRRISRKHQVMLSEATHLWQRTVRSLSEAKHLCTLLYPNAIPTLVPLSSFNV